MGAIRSLAERGRNLAIGQLRPDSAFGLYRRGRHALTEQDWETSTALFIAAIEAGLSDSTGARRLLARAQLGLGDVDEACLNMGAELARQPEDLGLRIEAAETLEAAGRLQEAVEVLAARTESQPRPGWLWFHIGRIQLKLLDWPAATHAFLCASEAEEDVATAALRHVRWGHSRVAFMEDVTAHRRVQKLAPRLRTEKALLGAGTLLLDTDQLASGREAIHRGYRVKYSATPQVLDLEHPKPPSFFVLGQPKAGSTTLHHRICQHPDVVETYEKELHFWGSRRGRSPEIYDAYFPPISRETVLVTGEATPTNLTSEEAMRNLPSRYPNARFVVIHRNPVDRAYSEFRMREHTGTLNRSFEEYVRPEIAAFADSLSVDPLEFQDDFFDGRYTSFLNGSLICHPLQRWIEAAGAERFLYLETDRMRTDPVGVMDAVYDFLGLEPFRILDLEPKNVGVRTSPLDPDFHAELTEWFAPHEAALAALVESMPNTLL